MWQRNTHESRNGITCKRKASSCQKKSYTHMLKGMIYQFDKLYRVYNNKCYTYFHFLIYMNIYRFKLRSQIKIMLRYNPHIIRMRLIVFAAWQMTGGVRITRPYLVIAPCGRILQMEGSNTFSSKTIVAFHEVLLSVSNYCDYSTSAFLSWYI